MNKKVIETGMLPESTVFILFRAEVTAVVEYVTRRATSSCKYVQHRSNAGTSGFM
jgi:hypothetical protein